MLFNVYLRDLMTCHKAIRTDVFKGLPLQAAGFAIEPEIAARLLQRGERIFEVPVHYKARGSDEGKKLTAMDGLRVVARWCAAGSRGAESARVRRSSAASCSARAAAGLPSSSRRSTRWPSAGCRSATTR